MGYKKEETKVKSVYDNIDAIETDKATVDADRLKEALLISIDDLESDLLVAEQELRTLLKGFDGYSINTIKNTVEKLVGDINEVREKLY